MVLRPLYSYFDKAGVLSRRGAPAGPGPTPTILLEEDFNTWPLGEPSPATWNNNMGGGCDQAGNNTNQITVVDDPIHGGKALRHLLKANAVGGSAGTAMVVPLSQQVDHAIFEIHFRFVGAFDFAGGGKLPGLAGVRPGYPISWAGGCPADWEDAKGWSGRHMWVGNPSPGHYSSRTDREGFNYMYGEDQTQSCGNDLYWGPGSNGTATNVFIPDTDHKIVTEYQMNDSGVTNGLLITDYDNGTSNVRVMDRNNKDYRGTKMDMHIDLMYWSFFRGGSTIPEWASEDDHYIDVYYIKVTAP